MSINYPNSEKQSTDAPAEQQAKPSSGPPLRGLKPRIRGTGSSAADAEPDNYVIRCDTAKVTPRGSKFIVDLRHVVEEDSWRDGIVFHQWFTLSGGDVSPASKYGRHCELELNRPIQKDEDLDPAKIFVGKKFLAQAGFSKEDADGNVADGNASNRKGEKDFVRIHELLELR